MFLVVGKVPVKSFVAQPLLNVVGSCHSKHTEQDQSVANSSQQIREYVVVEHVH